MHKQIVVNQYNEKLFINEKEQAIDICNTIDTSYTGINLKIFMLYKRSRQKNHVFYDSTYININFMQINL